MANITEGRGLCVAPFLELSLFPSAEGCEIFLVIRFLVEMLTFGRSARPVLCPCSFIRRQHRVLSPVPRYKLDLLRQ